MKNIGETMNETYLQQLTRLFLESCVKPAQTCNCDNNGLVWTSDEGYITDRKVLPVIKLKFGDNGDSSELGYHSLDALECF